MVVSLAPLPQYSVLKSVTVVVLTLFSSLMSFESDVGDDLASNGNIRLRRFTKLVDSGAGGDLSSNRNPRFVKLVESDAGGDLGSNRNPRFLV